MPFPSGLISDTQEYPLFKNVSLSAAPVAITPINTFVDIMTFGTLPVGTYQVAGQISVGQITAAAVITWKFLNGSAIVAAGEQNVITTNVNNIVIAPFIFSVLTAAIVKLQAASSALTSTAAILAATNGTGTTGFVTYMNAVRIA